MLHFKGTLENPGIATVQSPEQGCGPETADSGMRDSPRAPASGLLTGLGPVPGKHSSLIQKIPPVSPLPGTFLLHAFLLY